jgi:ribose transport system substrate-binding protein
MGQLPSPRRRLRGFAATIMILLITAGCSATPGSPSSAATTTPASVAPPATASIAAPSAAASASGASGGIAAAATFVEQMSAEQSFISPGDSIDVGPLKGKTVWIIVNSLQNPFNTAIATGATEALKKAGITTKVVDGKGQLNEWTRQFALALTSKADAIIDSGVPTDLIQGQLADIAAANIPLIEAVNDQNAPFFPGVKAHIAWDYKAYGNAMAAYAIATSGGNTGVLVYDDPEFATSAHVVSLAAQQYLKDNCPTCVVTVKQVQIATLAQDVPVHVQSAIRANPNIKWVIPTFDYMGGFVVQGLQQAGLTDVKVVGGDAVNAQLDQIRSGTNYVADAGVSPPWCGWAAADAIMRLMVGGTIPNNGNELVPFRLFTKDNLPPTNDPAALFKTDFQTEYLKLWGLQ